MDTTATIDTIGAWPVEDQLELVYRLWDQITEAGWQPTPHPALVSELERRVANYEANPSQVLTWEQIVTDVLRVR